MGEANAIVVLGGDAGKLACQVVALVLAGTITAQARRGVKALFAAVSPALR
ncbi:hypothetical protein ACLB1E_26660 [Escherichia coli]